MLHDTAQNITCHKNSLGKILLCRFLIVVCAKVKTNHIVLPEFPSPPPPPPHPPPDPLPPPCPPPRAARVCVENALPCTPDDRGFGQVGSLQNSVSSIAFTCTKYKL